MKNLKLFEEYTYPDYPESDDKFELQMLDAINNADNERAIQIFNDNDVDPNWDNGLLIMAAFTSHDAEILDLLLSNGGRLSEKYPLTQMAYITDVDVAKVLIDHGVDVYKILNFERIKAEDIAEIKKHSLNHQKREIVEIDPNLINFFMNTNESYIANQSKLESKLIQQLKEMGMKADDLTISANGRDSNNKQHFALDKWRRKNIHNFEVVDSFTGELMETKKFSYHADIELKKYKNIELAEVMISMIPIGMHDKFDAGLYVVSESLLDGIEAGAPDDFLKDWSDMSTQEREDTMELVRRKFII